MTDVRYVVRSPYYRDGCYRIHDREEARLLPRRFSSCSKALREAARLSSKGEPKC